MTTTAACSPAGTLSGSRTTADPSGLTMMVVSIAFIADELYHTSSLQDQDAVAVSFRDHYLVNQSHTTKIPNTTAPRMITPPQIMSSPIKTFRPIENSVFLRFEGGS